MKRAALLILGVLGEWAGITALLGSQPVWSRLMLFVTAHLIASLCLCVLLRLALPRQEETGLWGSLALFFSFAFFIPVLGGIGMLGALVYFRFFLRFEKRAEFFSVPMPPFMQEAGGPAPGMGEGGAWSRLRATTLPRALRLKALLAVGAGTGQNASRLLQLATSDSDDEIRLLAFNLSDRRGKVISRAISEARAELRASDRPADQAPLCRSLAFSYWEMVFNDLAKDELAVFFVNQALSYARRAHELAGDDAPLLVLTGRLYLWLNDTVAAEKAINAALAQGAPRDRVIPYLAELAYLRKDFATLKGYFAHDPLLRYKPGIGPVAQFWMG